MPPSVYGAPSRRAAASSDRSPAKTGWVWLSTRPGVTRADPRSTRSPSGASPGAPIHAIRPSRTSIAHGDGPPGARRPVPVRSIGRLPDRLVGDQAVDDDHERRDEQEVNKPAKRSQDEAEQPQNEQDDDDGPKHVWSLA